MNILLVVTGLADEKNPSGSSYNNRFAAALKAKGVYVTIIHLRAISPKRIPIRIRKNEDKIDIIELSCYLLYSVKKMPVFVSWIFRIQMLWVKNKYLLDIDAVHAISGGAIAPAYIISKYMEVPLISQFIGSDIAIQADYYKSITLFNKGLSMSRVLCFNSLGLKKEFETHFDLANEKRVLYRGINLKEFPYCLDLNCGVVVVLFLGGFPIGAPDLKGGLTLLEAIMLLDEMQLNRPIEIRIGGPNSLSKEYSTLLPLTLKNKDISVSFIGSVQRKQVINQLADSQIVLIPSLSEGVPNVLFEAMASGNAIIASNVGGIPEFVDDCTGVLIRSNDSRELANSIMSLVNDSSMLIALAVNARHRIEDYDYNDFIKNYISLYYN